MDQPKQIDQPSSSEVGEQMLVNVSANPPRVSRMSTIAAVSALLGMGGGYLLDAPFREKSEPDEKPCRNCGNLKRHNNDFCSGDCCREYRQRSR